ncbi:carbohydrate porin [Pseudomonas sp. Au-Pse12]|uniref:carbohydrate porin n=1 Tax=Pseudomonas sp. Au-Pse12 TaxID=2906459 RepID=UPI001E52CFA3|nr:carbohydrate porin [Pseudomonas sp. Au-Pse12]MCE4056154.1 carbohydrate porin [Pseudomonas sp. Au-Pse12]
MNTQVSKALIGMLASGFCGVALAAGPLNPESPWLLGDWNGERQKLSAQGFDFTLKYVAELGSNLAGGYDKSSTARLSDQIILGVDMDLNKLLGWQDATLRIGIGERHGRDISNDRVHHPDATGMTSTMEVYGGGNAWRLSQLWYEQKFFDRRLAVKLGRFGHGEDFDQFPCEFQNVTLCGSQEGNWNGAWNSFPISQWAIRARYQFTPEFYVQAGAYDKNPGNAEVSNGFKPFIAGSIGTSFPVEAVWKGRINDLSSEYHLGYYYSDVDGRDPLKDANGNPAALSGQPYRKYSDNSGWWLSAQQQLTTVDGNNKRGLNVFTNLTFNDPDSSFIENLIQVGLIYRGPFASRPDDTIGLGASRLKVNDRVSRNAELINAGNGVNSMADGLYVPEQKREYSVEINYGYQATRWLMVRPNLQYVKYPGGLTQTDSALVGGVQFIADF